MKTKDELKLMALRVPPKLQKKIKILAINEGMTMQEWITRVLEDKLKELNK